MGKQLLSASIKAPAFFGLNTQESGVTLEEGFAVEANNCIIDESGRLGARKGYKYITSGATGVNLRGIHNYIGNSGHIDYISWGNGNIYKGDVTLTSIESGHADNDWKATNHAGSVYLAQDGYPVKKVVSALTITNLTGTGVQQWGTINSAYGRLWAGRTTADKHTVHFSAIGTDTFDPAVAGVGSIDLRHV